MVDHMELDGLVDAFTTEAMGLLTERVNDAEPLTRADQDAFAAASHQRAAAAWDAGDFADEVVPVSVPQRRGEPVVVARDEGIRADTTVETLAKLPGAFRADGTVTAGNASPISDGACAMVVMDRARAEQLGSDLARRDRRPRHGRRARTRRCSRSPPTPSRPRARARASHPPTST